MINNITIGQYLPGESLLHRADPRTKILLVLFFMTAIFLINSYTGFFIFALFIMIVIITSGIPVSYTLKSLKPVVFIIAFTVVINAFTVSGEPVFQYGVFHVTKEGIHMSIIMASRLLLLIITASLLTLTTTPISLTDGMEKLMSPFSRFGLPAHEIAMMMSIALRFIPTLLEETDKIMKAQASRGADFDTGNLVQRAKSFIPVLVPLFIGAFRRADELATAMEARCYKGSVGRTRMKQLKFKPADIQVTVISLLFVAGLLFVEYI